MLEFIVLGQIPGTHLEITIAWFVFGLLGVLIWADIKLHAARAQSASPKSRSRKTTQARA